MCKQQPNGPKLLYSHPYVTQKLQKILKYMNE